MATLRRYMANPTLTAMVMMYRNAELIADKVMPRVTTSPTQLFQYTRYPIEQGFTVPDTKISRRGKPTEVSFEGELVEASTEDYGLDDPIPTDDITNAPPTTDPQADSAQFLMNLVDLGREQRVSKIVFDPASYAASNVEALTAGDRFDDPDSNPIRILLEALKTPIMRPTQMVFGEDAWTEISIHPQVVSAVLGNSGKAGIVTPEELARKLRIREILVGQSRVNTAKKGQDMVLDDVWGSKVAMHYQGASELAGNSRNTMWGFTQPYRTRESSSEYEKDISARGGQRVRVIDSMKEVVSAPALGFLLEDVID